VGILITTGTALAVMAAIANLARIVIVWLALRGTSPQERPAILRAIASLWAAKRIEVHARSRGTDD
jgi:hypothetical protein